MTYKKRQNVNYVETQTDFEYCHKIRGLAIYRKFKHLIF